MGLASLLLIGCAVVSAELLRRAWRYRNRSVALIEQFNCELLCLREARRQAEVLQHLAQAQTLTETIVDGGTATVRAVHRGIASIPFGILEAIPATSLPAKAVRKTHDAIADGVYSAIHSANRLLSEAARKAIQSAETEKKSAPTDKPPASD